MRAACFATLASILAVGVQAHFQLSYPEPRGPFVEDDEPMFCDNYVNAVDNRTTFPISGGYIILNSEHTSWTFGVEISTKQNPTSFANFTANNTDNGQDQLVRQFATGSGEGSICIPLDLNSTGISGVKDGANVTLQFIFDGGDGELFQCADVTLAANASLPGGCSNSTGSGSSDSNSTSSGSSSSGSGSGAAAVAAPQALPVALVLGVVSLLAAFF
ncbi:hypothetical protein PENSPDRAFT_645265 [Peniophora sp. CONT]|nr:hypothetical protein PENSPDRAFT_645265 [Peniophora sp. CONT]